MQNTKYPFTQSVIADCPVCKKHTLTIKIKQIRSPVALCDNCGLVNVEEKRKATTEEVIEFQLHT